MPITRHALVGLASLTSLLGCGSAHDPIPEPTAPDAPALAQAAAAEQAPEAAREAEAPFAGPVLDVSGLLDLRLAEPLPASRTQDAALAQHYVTTFYADAQPLEGFRFENDAVYAVVAGGPFHAFGMANPGEEPSASLKAEALKRARAGNLTLQMLVVDKPGVRTEKGLEVGHDSLAFERAYPGLTRGAMPALWEEPTCVASQDALWFFFDHCDSSRPAKLIRMVLRAPEPEPKAKSKAKAKAKASKKGD